MAAFVDLVPNTTCGNFCRGPEIFGGRPGPALPLVSFLILVVQPCKINEANKRKIGMHAKFVFSCMDVEITS